MKILDYFRKKSVPKPEPKVENVTKSLSTDDFIPKTNSTNSLLFQGTINKIIQQ